MILSRRVNDDDHRDGFTKWPFMTTHTWGEYPQGTWLLEVKTLRVCRGETEIETWKSLSGKLQHADAPARMAEGVDIDAPRHQGTTVHRIISCGSSLEISDCQKGPRGATERDLTTLTTVQRDYRRYPGEEKIGNIPIERCLRVRFSLSAFLISRRAAEETNNVYPDMSSCQSRSSFVILTLLSSFDIFLPFCQCIIFIHLSINVCW